MKLHRLLAATAVAALMAAGAHAASFTGQTIDGVLGTDQTPGVISQFTSPIVAPGTFNGVMQDVFGQTWDITVDVLPTSVVVDWTGDGNGNVESLGVLTIDLSGYTNGPVLGLTSYSCTPSGVFPCDISGGPSIGSLSSTSSSFDVSFNGLYSGETYTFGLGGVPEPASWALMLVGVAGLGATLRRRAKVAHAA